MRAKKSWGTCRNCLRLISMKYKLSVQGSYLWTINVMIECGALFIDAAWPSHHN